MVNRINNMTLRQAGMADRPGIINLVKSILTEFDQVYNPTGSERDLEEFDKFYNADGCAFYVVVKNEKIIGSIGILTISAQEAKIKKMYISRDFRNLGLAQILIDEIIRKAIEFGYKKLTLETMSEMRAAIYLYKKNGFIEVDREAQSRRCDIVMEKIL